MELNQEVKEQESGLILFLNESVSSDDAKKTAHEISGKFKAFNKWANEQIDLLK